MNEDKRTEAQRAALRAHLPLVAERIRVLIAVLDKYTNKVSAQEVTPVQHRTLEKIKTTRETLDRSLFNIERYLFRLDDGEVVCPF